MKNAEDVKTTHIWQLGKMLRLVLRLDNYKKKIGKQARNMDDLHQAAWAVFFFLPSLFVSFN